MSNPQYIGYDTKREIEGHFDCVIEALNIGDSEKGYGADFKEALKQAEIGLCKLKIAALESGASNV